MIFYLHEYPLECGKLGHFRSLTPIPMDASGCGFYSDRIYNAHNSASRFYIVTFGYGKNWAGNNLYDRQIDRYTLHFVFGGQGTFNGRSVGAGLMFFAPQNKKHTILHDPAAPMELAWIALSGTDLENQLDLIHLPIEPTITPFKNQEQIKQLILDTVYSPHNDQSMELFLFSRFYQILSLCNAINQPLAPSGNSRANIFYSDILSYINTHYAENLSVSNLASGIHISASYLRRICIEKSGKSPQELITAKRMNAAKAFLANDTASVEEIAALVGYANIGAFSKCFKREVGISPLQYRRQKAEEKRQRTLQIEQSET